MSKFNTILISLLLLITNSVIAEPMQITRVELPAKSTLMHVSSVIEGHGYKVAHVQRCDGGMKSFGYKTDLYRVIFFGKAEEVRRISESNPEFVPYVPLKMIVIAEGDETLLSIVNPLNFSEAYKDDKAMNTQLIRWNNDIRSIFKEMRELGKDAK